MQFALLVYSSSKFAFRIQERLGGGEGYNNTHTVTHVSTCFLAM
jgi:hypothetical protein